MPGRIGSCLAVAMAILVLGGPAVRDADAASRTAPRLVQNDTGRVAISRDEAADIARSATGGRVLSIELQRGGRPWYRVKVLVDGTRVRIVRIDARNGRVLN